MRAWCKNDIYTPSRRPTASGMKRKLIIISEQPSPDAGPPFAAFRVCGGSTRMAGSIRAAPADC
jgi:hypothetical protein